MLKPRNFGLTPPRRAVVSVALPLALPLALPAAATGQAVPIDRWLVANAPVEVGVDPLATDDAPAFPDRNAEAPRGTWTLLREDGAERFDLAAFVAEDAVVAHAYLRSPLDAGAHLSLGTEPCARLEAWLNGQHLAAWGRSAGDRAGGDAEVRLARGWNTLLVVLEDDGEGDDSCPLWLSGRLAPGTGPNPRDEDSPGALPAIQASRPPGVRRAHPEGLVTVTAPRIAGLAWIPDSDDLAAFVEYDLTAWGRDDGAGMSGTEDTPGVQRPQGRGRGRGGPPGGLPGLTASEGPANADAMRAMMVARLLGPPVVTEPAPGAGSVELRVAGERLVAAASDLRPGAPVSFEGTLPFRKLRDAALRRDGLRAEFRWRGGDAKGEAPMPAPPVLEALHADIEVELAPGRDGALRGRLRVPSALAGFALRGLGGTWTVDGAPADGGVLCSPCERGERFDVAFEPDGAESPRTRIANVALPDLGGDAASRSAVELLRALEGDNRRYRALLGS